jgi:protein subunit release factor A
MEERYEELSAQLSLPEVVSDREKYQKAGKALSDLETPVMKFRELKQVRAGLAEARAMLADPEMKAMAEEEIAKLAPREPASAEGSQRREKRHPRNSSGDWRRRGIAVCRRNLPHVSALCRAAQMED